VVMGCTGCGHDCVVVMVASGRPGFGVRATLRWSKRDSNFRSLPRVSFVKTRYHPVAREYPRRPLHPARHEKIAPGWQGLALAPSAGPVTRRGYHCRGQPGSRQGKPALGGRQSRALVPRARFAASSCDESEKNIMPLCRCQNDASDVAHLVLKDGRVIDLLAGAPRRLFSTPSGSPAGALSIIVITPGGKLRLRALLPSTVGSEARAP